MKEGYEREKEEKHQSGETRSQSIPEMPLDSGRLKVIGLEETQRRVEFLTACANCDGSHRILQLTGLADI